MNRILVFILLTIILFISCKTEREEKFKKTICGEWIFVRVGSDNDKGKKNQEEQIEFPSMYENLNYRKGYIFYNNNSCEDKRGYFKQIGGKRRREKRMLFLGTDTKYKVEDDSLKIFDLADSVWRGIKIRSITSDTLTLEINDTIFFKYARSNYRIDKTQTFDKVIVSTSGCYGTCPISSTSIDKFGNFIFCGERYTTKTGLFTSKVNPDLYRRIILNFKKADIDKLDENYSADWTDDETVTVTFIKDSKIYKTIRDYGRRAPREFYWAYTQLSYIYQKMDLKPLKLNTKEPLSITPVYFENKGKIYEIVGSERFYFVTELYKSSVVKHPYDKKYIFNYTDATDNLHTTSTDGRYYQFVKEDKIIILDLGYNFLIRNSLLKKFRIKNEYD